MTGDDTGHNTARRPLLDMTGGDMRYNTTGRQLRVGHGWCRYSDTRQQEDTQSHKCGTAHSM